MYWVKSIRWFMSLTVVDKLEFKSIFDIILQQFNFKCLTIWVILFVLNRLTIEASKFKSIQRVRIMIQSMSIIIKIIIIRAEFKWHSVIIRLGFMFMCLAKQVMMFKFLDQFIWALGVQRFKFKQQVMLFKWFVSIVVVTVMRFEFVVDIIRLGFVFMCQARQVTWFKYLD